MKDDFYVKYDNDFFEFDITRVSNLLKQIVNKCCVKDFAWFDDVDENNMPTVTDILMLITTLESLKNMHK